MRYARIANSVLASLLLMIAAPSLNARQSIAELQTIAESSDYQATSMSSDVVQFVDVCASAEHVNRLDFGTTFDGKPMVAAVVANPAIKDLDTRDDRLRILLLGNIHSGECDGKEALLALLRELALDPDHPWLSSAVIVIAPNYNADANDRVGPGHRPGQLGPVAGMGLRENAMQLDLNRDFVKLESPEARALVRMIHQFDPHMFIDCHTTNGSKHQYKLTYDIPHNPSAPQSIRDYLRHNMMPAVTQRLKESGIPTFYYGNFSRDNSRWESYGYEPRYSTEYVGLRGRIGILSESYSYATYQERIAVTDAFVRQCVDHIRSDANGIKSLLEDSRQSDIAAGKTTPQHLLVHLQADMVAFPGTVDVAGYRDEKPFNYKVAFMGDFQPTATVSAPFCYLLPRELSLQAERLQMHGIQIELLAADTEMDVTIYRPTLIRKETDPFQGHNMVTAEASTRKEKINVPAGTLIVRTGQPLARLITYMLEPESNDGLVTWNFLDSCLDVNIDYPIHRVDRPINIMTQPYFEWRPRGQLRLADIFGAKRIEIPETSLDDVSFLPDGKSYAQEKNGRRIVIDVASGGESAILPRLDRERLMKAFESAEGISQSDVNTMLRADMQICGEEQRLFVLQHAGRNFVFDSQAGKVQEIGSADSPAELVDVAPDGVQVAWVQDHNLVVMQASLNPLVLTEDGSETLFNGKLDWVYQEELYGRGNFKGFWWSPDSKFIAWLKTDESPVKKFTVTDHLPVLGRLEVTPYPKAGDPLPIVSLHIHNFDSRTTLEFTGAVKSAGADGELLFSRVTWDRISQTLLVQVQNRKQTWLDLFRFDPGNAKTTLLFRDSTPAWVTSPGDPIILDDGSFLWTSTRTGFNAIYHYAADGKSINQLTHGDWEVRTLDGCDQVNRRVYFSGSPDTPLRVVPMSVALGGGEVTRLFDEPGNQAIKFNKDFTFFLCASSTATTPDSIKLYKADGSFVRTVVANQSEWIDHLETNEPEFLTIPVGSGDDIGLVDGMMIKPANFDASKKWPVVVHVYGGPQTPRVRDKFGGQNYLWHQFLTQQGFVVLLVDNRSSSYRAIRQTWPIYRDLATRELEDLETAMTWLKTNDWVDGERIGLWGWSYGGYMTAYALTHSTTFAAGIAGAPVTDWRNYDAIYTERFMSTPQDNPDGYAKSSVISVADQLHGKLLLIHGTMDDNVHISNSMQFVHALQRAGKQFELMVYPDSRHHVRDPEQQQHLYQLMTDFFKKTL